MFGKNLAYPHSGEGGPIEPRRERGYEMEPWEAEAYSEGPSLLDIPTIFGAILRHKWVFLGLLAACLLAAIAWVATQTPLYRATATLELNPTATRAVDLEGASEDAVQPDADYLALQLGLLESRSLAERVARQLNLSSNEAFLGGKPTANLEIADVAGQLMENFTATGTMSNRIVEISYVHPNPNVAAQVANAYAEEAVENTFDRAYESTARSRAFLQRQLEATRGELERSERELIEYARDANIVNVVSQDAASSADSAGGTLLASNLVALNEQLADAQNERIVAQQRLAQGAASANAAAVSDSTVQSLEQQRAQAQAEYQQKLERYLPDHPEMVALRARLDGLQTQIAQAKNRTSSSVTGSLRADFVSAQNRERALQAKIDQLESQLLDLNDRGVQYTILRRAVEANRSLYNSLLAKLGEESASGTSTSSVALIDSAQPPSSPFEPNILRTLLVALLGGLGLGTITSIGLDRWRDTINSPEDIRIALRMAVLGVIPKLGKDEEIDEELRDPRSPVAEAYHSTRSAIDTLVLGNAKSGSIVFTSARASEGKTSSVIALAADFLSMGKQVAVVDADLRNPSIQGAVKDGGLTAVLSESSTLERELRSTDTPGLYLLHAGKPPPDPTVLLASPRFNALIRHLESKCDVVIIDGPPVMGLADAPLIASCASATVLVVEAGKTRRGSAASAVNRLVMGGATMAGAILTKYDGKLAGYGYGYGDYNYDYKSELGVEKRRLIGPTRQSEDA